MDREQERQVEENSEERLINVKISISGSRTQPGLLEQYLHSLSRAASVGQLQERLLGTLQRLNELSSFKRCDMEVHPGEAPDSALVRLKFEPLRWWGASMGVDANNEGARTTTTAFFRNLRGRCDETKVSFEYKPIANRTGIELSHVDRLFLPGTLQAIYSLRNYNDELDMNLVESGYEGSFTLRNIEGSHQVAVARNVRTNSVAWERASMELLQSSVPVTARNRLAHTWTVDRRDDKLTPMRGYLFSLLNEVAYGADTKYHKVEFRGKAYWPVSQRVALELATFVGVIPQWEGTKVHVNDRYRGLFLKGFRSVGPRYPPANRSLLGKYHFDGDDLGHPSQATAEAKLLFYHTPVLSGVGLTPFIYANAIGINPLAMRRPINYINTQVRTSVGFGLGWNMAFGRLEFSYAARVFGKPGDYPAEFQVLFAS